jgi:hypothetical protein
MLAKSAASDNHQSARPPRLILIDAPFSSRLSRYSRALHEAAAGIGNDQSHARETTID